MSTQSQASPASAPSPAVSSPGELRGNIGVIELMFTVLAYNAPLTVFIGGIPVVMLVGNGLGAPVALLAGGCCVALVAFGLTTMSATLRRSGGFYSFISAGLGKVAGLASAFAATTCYFVAILVAVAFGGAATQAVVVGIFDGPETPWWLSGLVFLGISGVLGYMNISLSARVLSTFLALELFIMGAYIVAVLAHGGGPSGFGFESFTPAQMFSGSVSLAFMLGVGMFGGFEATVIFRDEVRDPERTIPRATYGVVALMAILYAFITWVFISSYGAAAVMDVIAPDPAGAATASIRDFTGDWAYDAAAVLMLTSTFALLLAAHNITSRYLYNLSADGILPRPLSEVHPKHKSPAKASILVTAASAAALAIFGLARVDDATMYARVVGVYSYLLLIILGIVALAIAVYLLRRSGGGRERAAGLSALLGFVIFSVAVVLATKNFSFLSGATGALGYVLLCLIWGIALAGGLLAVRLRTTKPEVFARIGRDIS